MLDYNAIMQAAMALSAQVDDLPAEQPQTSLPLEIPPRFRTKAMAQVLRRQGLVEQAEAIAPTHLTLTEDSPWEATSVETFSLVAQAPEGTSLTRSPRALHLSYALPKVLVALRLFETARLDLRLLLFDERGQKGTLLFQHLPLQATLTLPMSRPYTLARFQVELYTPIHTHPLLFSPRLLGI